MRINCYCTGVATFGISTDERSLLIPSQGKEENLFEFVQVTQYVSISQFSFNIIANVWFSHVPYKAR
jgi:hypothetical protein